MLLLYLQPTLLRNSTCFFIYRFPREIPLFLPKKAFRKSKFAVFPTPQRDSRYYQRVSMRCNRFDLFAKPTFANCNLSGRACQQSYIGGHPYMTTFEFSWAWGYIKNQSAGRSQTNFPSVCLYCDSPTGYPPPVSILYTQSLHHTCKPCTASLFLSCS